MQVIRLEKDWFIDKDENDCGEKLGWSNEISSSALSAFVPSIIQQFLPEYHGVAFYWKKFVADFCASKTDRVYLNFGGVDYKADVWLNGIKLGAHEGGEEPFSFDVTNVLKTNEENLLAVRVVNPTEKSIDGFTLYDTPRRNKVARKCAGSCLNHGGIWFGVDVSVMPAISIVDKKISGNIDTGEIEIELEIGSNFKEEKNALLSISVFDKTDGNKAVYSNEYSLKTIGVNTKAKYTVKIDNHKLWSTKMPNLYSVYLKIESEYGKDESISNFGFRSFYVKDGWFYLNKDKIFLRSSHTGNAFPIGQMLPVLEEQTNKDLLFAKSCGFNMIRSIAGQLRPEQLDFADEIGLLIYEECFASWCLNFSQCVTWVDEEDYQDLRKRRTDLPFAENLQPVFERWENATGAMIKRDRNHPSIVAWGLLNETKNNGIFHTAVNYLPKLRKLDETRLVFLNSQRTDYSFDVGSASNPYSNKWDNVFGNDGITEDSVIQVRGKELGFKDNANWTAPAPRAGDTHVYGDVPFDSKFIKTIRSLGSNTPLPVFLSETGVGSLFNVIDEYKHFVQNGCREDLEDASWLKYQSDRLEQDWKRFNLYSVFPFADDFLKESQRINAQDRYRFFNVVRSNPTLNGYSLTGLLDHGMCGEGLWSYWRKMKPEMFDAVSDGWSRLRFCMFATENSYTDSEIELECVLASEGVLESGEYTADFAIVGDSGVVCSFSHTFNLKKEDFVTPVFKKKIILDVPTGKYTLSARLDKGAPSGDKLFFYVTNKKDVKKIFDTVYVKGLKEETKELLRDRGLCLKDYNGETDGVILLGDVLKEDVEKAILSAKTGAKVAIINYETFYKEGVLQALEYSDDLQINRKRDWLYHKEYVITKTPVFDGFAVGLVDAVRFGQTFPHNAFETQKIPDDIICPGFQTGYHGENMSYGQYWSIFGYNKEKGKVLLSTFDIENNLANPVSGAILTNIVDFLAKAK